MPDPTPVPPSTPSSSPVTPPAQPPAVPSGPTIHIGEEFGTARKNLPPVKIVLIAVGGSSCRRAHRFISLSAPNLRGLVRSTTL